MTDIEENGTITTSTGNELADTSSEIVLQVSSSDTLGIGWGSTLVQEKGEILSPFILEDHCYGLLLVSQGTLQVAVDGKPFTVNQGQTLVLRPDEECAGTAPHEADIFCPWIALWLKSPGRRNRKRTTSVPRVADTRDPLRLTEMFMWIVEDSRDAARNPRIPNLLSTQYQLLSLLARLDLAELDWVRPASPQAVLAERAKSYIKMQVERNCDCPASITSDSLAEVLECSGSYLRKAFRNTFGESVASVVLKSRMNWARRNLSMTRMSITQVAYHSGFTSLNYFTRTFTKLHGMSPSQYRSAHAHPRICGAI